MAAAVDREIAHGAADSIGPVFVTPSLLLWPRKFTVTILRLQDVVWMYHHNLASHGVHSAIFHLRTKKITGVVLRKQLVPSSWPPSPPAYPGRSLVTTSS